MSSKVSNEYQPIIKWVGGKSEILVPLFENIPTVIDNYYECFAGGGSVFLHLLEMIEKKKIIAEGNIYINDLNSHLIHLYETIKTDVDGLIEYLEYKKFISVNNITNPRTVTLLRVDIFM